MKSLLLACGALLAATALNAQLSFLPQAGFEQSRTALNYNNGLMTSDMSGNFKAALKVDYRLKGGHSPFINVTTSPAPVSFAFTNAGSLETNFQSAKSNLRLRLEAGYQYSSLPIRLGKKTAALPTPAIETANSVQQRSSCGSAYRSSCGSKRKANKAAAAGPLNMRLQPALALAYVPSNTESVMPTANGFQYTAGTWKTALVPSMGFEFAKGSQRLFTLTVFYTKPLSESPETAIAGSGFKAVSVPLQPKTTTWGITAGVPFGFTKSTHTRVKERSEKRQCQRVLYRCCGVMQ